MKVIKKYRKKPVVVEAYQTDKVMYIETLEGIHKANAGDYIITGIHGEQYPCKPDIFEETYEDVSMEMSQQEQIHKIARYHGIPQPALYAEEMGQMLHPLYSTIHLCFSQHPPTFPEWLKDTKTMINIVNGIASAEIILEELKFLLDIPPEDIGKAKQDKLEQTLKMLEGKKCTACGQICYDDKFPEIVFQDDKNRICEECSINYEQDDGEVRLREV